MGLFNKKKKEVKKKVVPAMPELPKLPELPRLPELPGMEEMSRAPHAPISQLPSFPSNSLGDKFSQNNIKEAVTGKKEDDEEFDADDFDEEEMRMMPKPPKRKLTMEMSPSDRMNDMAVPHEFREAARVVKHAEPVFIRIDKFEESMKTFNKARSKILEIENLLKNIKKIKEEEEMELEAWENEIKSMKAQIERVDKDIFSKIE